MKLFEIDNKNKFKMTKCKKHVMSGTQKMSGALIAGIKAP